MTQEKPAKRKPKSAPLSSDAIIAAAIDLLDREGLDNFSIRNIATLARAGFAGEDLVAAYNAVITGLCGYATQEFAHVFPDPDGDLEASLTASVEEADPALYPTLAAERHRLLNRALVLRWQNGTEASLEPGFEMFTDALIAGLAQKAKHANTPE